MSVKPFAAARAYLNFQPFSKWTAIFASAFASLSLLALLPVIYLFVDLLDTHGRIPTYATLTPNQQAAFRETWVRDYRQVAVIAEKLKQLKVTPLSDNPTNPDWEIRHTIVMHADLALLVNSGAAESFFPYETIAANPTSPVTMFEEFGILPTVLKNRDHIGGRILGRLASWLPWTWQPTGNNSANGRYLTALLIFALVLLGVRGALLNLNSFCATTATIEAGQRMRRAIYTHSQRISAVAVRADEQKHVGELVSTKVDAVQEGLLATLSGVVFRPPFIVALMAILLAGNFWLSAALLCAGVIVWLIAGQAAARFRRDARISTRRVEARLGMMKESLSSMTLAKAYLMERFSQTRFERHLSELSKSLWRKRRGDTFSQPTLVTIVGLAVALMLYLAGRVILSGELSLAALVLKCVTMTFLVLAISRWAAAVARIRVATQAAEEVIDFLDRRGDVAQTVDAEFLQPMTKKLELVDVSLRETGTGRMLLDKISLTVPIGQKLAILAPDAEESLSFAYLLTRFQDPTGGEVRIDGKNTRWVTYESIRTQVALIMQQSLTFSDTVANNIGCGEQSFTLPQIIEAAKVAHAHQFIQRLPYGYETTIGELGHSLKPGEQFRIALARAILRDPSILIIQEPTDPFDADSIVLIDDTLNRIRANRTIIFLTRRDATLRLVDQIAVIQAGKLIVVGKHQDLLASSDLYRVLHLSHS